MSANIFNAAQIKMLGDKLAKTAVKSRAQGGSSVQYIEGWHAINEANRIFGAGAWDHEIIDLHETNRDKVAIERRKGSEPAVIEDQWRIGYLAKVRVTVHGEDGQKRVKEGIGFGSGMSKDNAIGEAVESAAKEAETDALKRALIKFGNPFGLALYDKDRASVGKAEYGSDDINTGEVGGPPAPEVAPQTTASELIEVIGKAASDDEISRALRGSMQVLRQWQSLSPDTYNAVQNATAARRAALKATVNGHHPDGIAV